MRSTENEIEVSDLYKKKNKKVIHPTFMPEKVLNGFLSQPYSLQVKQVYQPIYYSFLSIYVFTHHF